MYQPMGIYRTNSVAMRSVHWRLLYGVTFGPTKIRKSSDRTTPTKMNSAICVGSVTMLLCPYFVAGYFSVVRRPENRSFLRHLLSSRARELMNQFIRRFSSRPNFLVLVLVISHRRCATKAERTISTTVSQKSTSPILVGQDFISD
jgi:hypothetical protein